MSPVASSDNFLSRQFLAMGCPCEVLLDSTNTREADHALALAESEAHRIESKYSRYRAGTVVDRINSSQGRRVEVDEETAALLDYAANNFELSGGLFDITSGVLRKAWLFDGTEYAEAPQELPRLLDHLGWNKVTWTRPYLQIPEGFEIDLGGICKEYAADKILALLRQDHPVSTLINLGGDIAAAGTRLWSVGIEDASKPGRFVRTVHLKQGGIATSGTTKRFLKIAGQLYGHILNPKTGWPVKEAPASVTVAAATCTEAGFWSTLALLHGSDAEKFLDRQHLEYWCYRHA